MPLYEYYCNKCNYKIEIIHKISDTIDKLCSQCRQKLEKKPSLTSFRLKGSGWYKDGYSNKNKEIKQKPKETNTVKKTPEIKQKSKNN